MLREEVSILIVDDVNTMRIQIRELLRNSGFRNISVAANGEEAKQSIELQSYQLLLVDWQMEPTDGLDLLKYVRAHPDYSKVAFMMVTAESTRDRVLQAIQAGVDDYLVKPLTPDQIKTKVYSLLTRKQVIG
jgi:two-component system chemotaxis response regulator CheY